MTGLRARLVAAIGVTVIVTMAVAFAVVYRQTGSELRAELDRTVRGSAVQLADEIREHPRATASQALTLARRFAGRQPYSRAAVLYFAVVPGHGTASNYPELFGGGPVDSGEAEAEQPLENAEGRRLQHPHVGYADQPAPDTGLLRTFEEAVHLANGTTIYAGAGEPLAGIAHAQHGVRRTYLLAGAVGLAIALIGAFLAGSRIAAPLRRAAQTASLVDGGDLSPRLPEARAASREVRVLAGAFNRMLDRLRDAFDSQRDFVADASHELRTPLTVIRGQLELLSTSIGVESDDLTRSRRLIEDEVTRMSRLTDDLLLLAHLGESDFLHPRSFELHEFVTDLWDGLSLTADRVFELGPVPRLVVTADPDRLAQALRNLGRNAIQHTRPGDGVVRLETVVFPGSRSGPAELRFTVCDDGPGIPPDQRQRVFERFYRTDPARARRDGGVGLGLAIVKAIAIAHGGSVNVTDGESPGLGGAVFELVIPLLPDV